MAVLQLLLRAIIDQNVKVILQGSAFILLLRKGAIDGKAVEVELMQNREGGLSPHIFDILYVIHADAQKLGKLFLCPPARISEITYRIG